MIIDLKRREWEDLKAERDRLKEEIVALLAHLQAAEVYASRMRKGWEGWFNPEYEAWQKARKMK